jgi:tRNA-binding EMAP/Myf-like protein
MYIFCMLICICSLNISEKEEEILQLDSDKQTDSTTKTPPHDPQEL